ncbi:hypothetical protein F2981_32105 (plasmid) [Sinorhizobium meliloti]|nr:hypothetical protein [Sinorhizobium meliloti]
MARRQVPRGERLTVPTANCLRARVQTESILPEEFLTIAARLLPYARTYATGSMQRATVSTILVSTRSSFRVAGDALRVSPIVRSRQAAVAFPAGNRSMAVVARKHPTKLGTG